MKWNVPVELDEAEAQMVERLGRKAKFYVFRNRPAMDLCRSAS